MNKSDRDGCHLCGCIVYIAPSADPFRRVLCDRCKADEVEDVETDPTPGEPLLRHNLASDVERFEGTKRRKT